MPGSDKIEDNDAAATLDRSLQVYSEFAAARHACVIRIHDTEAEAMERTS
jgi:hypothetical protein